MVGKYNTPEGIFEVESFDAKNKTVRVHIGSGQYRFFNESEYSKWESLSGEYVADENKTSIATTTEEVPEKPKKKKSDTANKK